MYRNNYSCILPLLSVNLHIINQLQKQQQILIISLICSGLSKQMLCHNKSQSSSNNPKHLLTFTSILSLLSLQNPQIRPQLQHLRLAVVKWYEGIQQQMLKKNRAIIAARTRGYEKLFIFFNKLENYFQNLLSVYNDPNMRLYFKQFIKIKEEFQFIDIDFDKFCNKYTQKQVQTDKQSMFMFGVDVDKLMTSLQTKQNDLNQANNVIASIDNDNQQLNHHIRILTEQMKRDEEDFLDKIKDMRQQLQKAKVQAITTRSQTQYKNLHNYRSNPQIPLSQHFSNRKIMRNLLQNAYQNSLMDEAYQSIQVVDDKKGQPQFLRYIYSQALTIQGMLQSVQAYEKARNN